MESNNQAKNILSDSYIPEYLGIKIYSRRPYTGYFTTITLPVSEAKTEHLGLLMKSSLGLLTIEPVEELQWVALLSKEIIDEIDRDELGKLIEQAVSRCSQKKSHLKKKDGKCD